VYAFAAADHLQIRYLQPVIQQKISQEQKEPKVEKKAQWLSRRPAWLK
jgi:hypothetical protein